MFGHQDSHSQQILTLKVALGNVTVRKTFLEIQGFSFIKHIKRAPKGKNGKEE